MMGMSQATTPEPGRNSRMYKSFRYLEKKGQFWQSVDSTHQRPQPLLGVNSRLPGRHRGLSPRELHVHLPSALRRGCQKLPGSSVSPRGAAGCLAHKTGHYAWVPWGRGVLARATCRPHEGTQPPALEGTSTVCR